MVKLELADYKAAIVQAFPELKSSRLDFLAEGGNSVACLLDETLVFLFPKTKRYEGKLLRQVKLLPELAPTLPLSIPNFRYIAYKPSEVFPFAFAGYDLIPGQQVVECPQAIWDAEWWLKPFGEFVTALHRFPLEKAEKLGLERFSHQDWRIGYFNWWQGLIQNQLYPLLTPSERSMVHHYLEEFLSEPGHFEFEPVLLHADLHLAHILLDLDSRRINGVIDFGDCKIGDPALDMRNAWEPFYQGKRDATWAERRIFYYRVIPLDKILIGIRDGNTAEINDGIAEFRRKWAE